VVQWFPDKENLLRPGNLVSLAVQGDLEVQVGQEAQEGLVALEDLVNQEDLDNQVYLVPLVDH
jgi:hypothetical protein